NFCSRFATGLARIKIVGKILINIAIEKVFACYGRHFNPESERRKRRIFRLLGERIFHNRHLKLEKPKAIWFQEGGAAMV
ncbi:PIPO, partial [Zantedeschia mild mosaic virus]|uniref:PIPO n=1 Tax=Zantedeschia mild mosaic virus TaxID=270478 RepID=UPI00026515E5